MHKCDLMTDLKSYFASTVLLPSESNSTCPCSIGVLTQQWRQQRTRCKLLQLTRITSLQLHLCIYCLHFNSNFLTVPVLARFPLHQHLFWNTPLGLSDRLSWDGFPTYYPINSVKALKGTWSMEVNQGKSSTILSFLDALPYYCLITVPTGLFKK